MRRTDLDALRILFCASVILAHASIIFAPHQIYHLTSTETSFTAAVVYELIHVTTMPAFMLIAGWSAVRSLRGRSAARFVWERVKRLFVPLAFGAATFCCVIKYIELLDGRNISLSGLGEADNLQHMLRLDRPATFLDFAPYYLSRMSMWTWSHLWFLGYLFLFSCVFLPLLVWLSRRTLREDVPPTIVVYLPAVGLALLIVLVGGYWPFLPKLKGDWGNMAFYGICFLIGAGMAVWPGFERRLHTQTVPLVVLTLVTFIGLMAWGESTPGRICAGLTSWFGTAALLALAAKYSPPPSPALTWLSEAALPVYILHHAPLLLIAVAVLPLALPVAVKIVIIWWGTTAVSVAAYQWLVRPWPPLRFLLGLGPQRAPVVPPLAAAAPGR